MIKEGKKIIQYFSSTEVGTLVEEFTSQVKIVGENVLGLSKKMDKMDERLGNVEDDIGIIKMDIAVIKNDLKNKVNRDEFVILEKRVALLEARVR